MKLVLMNGTNLVFHHQHGFGAKSVTVDPGRIGTLDVDGDSAAVLRDRLTRYGAQESEEPLQGVVSFYFLGDAPKAAPVPEALPPGDTNVPDLSVPAESDPKGDPAPAEGGDAAQGESNEQTA